MGNLFKKQKKSSSRDEKSKPHNESGLTSIHTETEMPSVWGRSAYYKESRDIATKSNEGACPKKLILYSGDLIHMQEFDAWAAAANRKVEWSQEKKQFAYAFRIHCCDNSDGASLDALIHLPHFRFIAGAIISGLHPSYLDDPLFLARLHDALLPHVLPEHESDLRRWLCEAIKKQYPVSVREFYDALWAKSFLSDINDCQTIKDFYEGHFDKLKKEMTNASLIKSVIQFGISRHIRVMLHVINDPLYEDALDTHSISKLLEWAISSNFNVDEIHCLRHIDTENVPLVQDWNDERQLFTSQISEHTSQLCQTKSEYIIDSIVPRILERMVICEQNCRTDEKAKAISWLLNQICKAMEEDDPGATCEPILVGSASECTQALFIDEFDHVLLTNSKLKFNDIQRALNCAVLKMTNMHHPRLVLGSMALDTNRSYPCLYITWVDEHLRNRRISIDLVPAKPLMIPVTLPHHNFLPVPREQLPEDGDFDDDDDDDDDDAQSLEEVTLSHHNLLTVPREQWPSNGDARQSSNARIVDHDDVSSIAAKNTPRLFAELKYDDPVYSQVENGVIKALPSYIIEGYRLAKSFRITHVIRPIIQKLIELGVTLDIHKIIRTYHLKTCVFYLTQHYVYDDSDIEENNRWTWAIAIFMKLREFVMLGDVNEFFATERFIFKDSVGHDPECEHDEEDFTAPLPRLRCCRRRKARLLMVDQILRVLRDSKSKYQPKNKAFGKALSNAVNTSLLSLI